LFDRVIMAMFAKSLDILMHCLCISMTPQYSFAISLLCNNYFNNYSLFSGCSVFIHCVWEELL
jgi:hypothetical protein